MDLPLYFLGGFLTMIERLDQFCEAFLALRPKGSAVASDPVTVRGEGAKKVNYLFPDDHYQNEYRDFARFLFIDSDAIDGIDSHFLEKSPSINKINSQNSVPTGLAFLRNAYKAKPLNQQCPANHFLREKNYLLQRVTAIVRGVDYQLRCLMEIDINRKGHYANLRAQLKKDHVDLVDAILKTVNKADKSIKELPENYPNRNRIIKGLEKEANQALKNLEKRFNSTKLVNILLLSGLCRTKDINKIPEILLQNRLLSSTLDPAPSLITYSHFKASPNDLNEINLVQVDHPITEKTAKQKQDLQLQNSLSDEGKSYHAKKPYPLRLLNALYSRLMLLDDRTLPAQSRKTHATTVKNGFISYLFVNGSNADEHAELKQVRHASLVYVGKGETRDKRIADTVGNLEQVFSTLQKHDIDSSKYHYQLLVTDYGPADLNHETEITNITSSAIHQYNKTHQNSLRYSITPLNGFGKFQEIFKNFAIPSEKKSGLFSWLKRRFTTKKIRAHEAANLDLKMHADSGISGGNCASGQDRKGTHLTLVKRKFIAALKFVKDGFSKKVQARIEEGVIGSRHNIVVNHLLVPGSAGHKTDSLVEGLFGSAATEQMYPESAKTNKKVALDPDLVEKMVQNFEKHAGPQKDLSVLEFVNDILDFVEKTRLNSQKRYLLLSLIDEIWQAAINSSDKEVGIPSLLKKYWNQDFKNEKIKDILFYQAGEGLIADPIVSDFMVQLEAKYKNFVLPSSLLEAELETIHSLNSYERMGRSLTRNQLELLNKNFNRFKSTTEYPPMLLQWMQTPTESQNNLEDEASKDNASHYKNSKV